MATKEKEPKESSAEQAAQPSVVYVADPLSNVAREQQAIAAASREAKEKHLDETTPGGRYLVHGQLVDAEGRAVEE